MPLDVKVTLDAPGAGERDEPKPARRPYPQQYVWTFAMEDGPAVAIRPICPEDEPLLARFHETLSETSVYYRYFHMINLEARVAHERLAHLCFIDYDREMALIAERKNPATGAQELLGVGRLANLHDAGSAEFAVIVSDHVQRLGLGTELLRRLVEIGRLENIAVIKGYIVPENVAMQTVAKNVGFDLRYSQDERLMIAELSLTREPKPS